MARLGRKLLLTERTTEDLCAALGIGATIEIACSYAGVSTDCYYLWMRKAKEVLELLAEDPQAELSTNQVKYLKFYNKIDKTQSYAAIGWLQVIERSATTDPNWARFMLKVRYPEGYSETTRQALDVTTGGEPLTFRVIYDDDVKRDFAKAPQRAIGDNTDSGEAGDHQGGAQVG